MGAFGPDRARLAPSQSWTTLSGELAERFQVVEEFATQGAEADVLRVRERRTGQQRVLKVYRPGIALRPEVLERLRNADPEHVVRLEQWDRSRDRWYEVLEYVPGGTLRDLLRAEGPRLGPELLNDILLELATALAHLHFRGVAHLDLKPENVLVRDRDRKPRLDLVLADFGLAAVTHGTLRFSDTGLTALYAAPEALANVVSPSRDWWSLGMMILEALTGAHPFDNLGVPRITLLLVLHPVDTEGVEDPRWKLLVQGLLTRDADKRWGSKQVEAWLGGETPPVYFEATSPELQAWEEMARRRMPYRVGDQECDDLQTLGRLLAANWDEARTRLGKDGDLRERARARRTPEDLELAHFLKVLHGSGHSEDLQLVRLIHHLDPTAPPVFRGFVIHQEGLRELAAEAASQPDGPAALALENLSERRVLSTVAKLTGESRYRDLDERWHAGVERFRSLVAQVRESGGPGLQGDWALRARLLLAELDPQWGRRLLAEANRGHTRDARQQSWYASLGSPDEKDPAGLLALRVFGDVAAAQTRMERRERRPQELALHGRQLTGFGLGLGALAGLGLYSLADQGAGLGGMFYVAGWIAVLVVPWFAFLGGPVVGFLGLVAVPGVLMLLAAQTPDGDPTAHPLYAAVLWALLFSATGRLLRTPSYDSSERWAGVPLLAVVGWIGVLGCTFLAGRFLGEEPDRIHPTRALMVWGVDQIERGFEGYERRASTRILPSAVYDARGCTEWAQRYRGIPVTAPDPFTLPLGEIRFLALDPDRWSPTLRVEAPFELAHLGTLWVDFPGQDREMTTIGPGEAGVLPVASELRFQGTHCLVIGVASDDGGPARAWPMLFGGEPWETYRIDQHGVEFEHPGHLRIRELTRPQRAYGTLVHDWPPLATITVGDLLELTVGRADCPLMQARRSAGRDSDPVEEARHYVGDRIRDIDLDGGRLVAYERGCHECFDDMWDPETDPRAHTEGVLAFACNRAREGCLSVFGEVPRDGYAEFRDFLVEAFLPTLRLGPAFDRIGCP